MKRLFSPDSLWNRPIGSAPEIDPGSRKLTAFLAGRDPRGPWINISRWTVPLYEVDRDTPRHRVLRRFGRSKTRGVYERSIPYLHPDHPLGHGPGFAEDAAAGLIPIPDGALPDPENDAHMALVDWSGGWVWDMWAVRKDAEGNWECASGMKYRVDGDGVFDRGQFAVHDGESIHLYGPGRAAGVPVPAGLVLHDEVLAGRIEHKLAFATPGAAFRKFVHPPACWTDGGWRDGLPEGAVLQLDPELDLSRLNLSPAARTVARALQEYGAVCVDVAGGHVLYAQGLYADPSKRSWEGLLASDELISLTWDRFRVLKMDGVIHQGMGPRVPDGIYAGEEEMNRQGRQGRQEQKK